MRVSLIVLSVLFSYTLLSQDVVSTKFGKGLYNVVSKDSSWSMKFGMRIQSLYVGEWDINDATGIGQGSSN